MPNVGSHRLWMASAISAGGSPSARHCARMPRAMETSWRASPPPGSGVPSPSASQSASASARPRGPGIVRRGFPSSASDWARRAPILIPPLGASPRPPGPVLLNSQLYIGYSPSACPVKYPIYMHNLRSRTCNSLSTRCILHALPGSVITIRLTDPKTARMAHLRQLSPGQLGRAAWAELARPSCPDRARLGRAARTELPGPSWPGHPRRPATMGVGPWPPASPHPRKDCPGDLASARHGARPRRPLR